VLLETVVELLPLSELLADADPESLAEIELDKELESDNELIDEYEADELSDGE
jgi:hypothetical protein